MRLKAFTVHTALALVMMTLCATSCGSDAEPSVDFPETDIPGLLDLSYSDGESLVNTGLNDFGYRFFNEAVADRQLIEDNDGNVAVSPLSAALGLSMVANTGDSEIEKAVCDLFGATDLNDLNSTCNKLMRHMNYEEWKNYIRIANSAWYNHSLVPSREWAETLESTFYASVSPLDFSDEQSVNVINKWCALNTKGMIDKIVDNLDPTSVLKLTNALCFCGEWVEKFSEKNTRKVTFNGKNGNSKVKMMHGDFEKIAHREGDHYDMIDLNFKGVFTLVLILPKTGFDAMEIAKTLTYKDFMNWGDVSFAKVHLDLPKFKINTEGDVTGLINKLGIPVECVFEKMGISGSRELNISQFTCTEIDEDGAKVAAVTDIRDITSIGAPKVTEDITLTFDRPFIYIIENRTSLTPLIAGVVNNIK